MKITHSLLEAQKNLKVDDQKNLKEGDTNKLSNMTEVSDNEDVWGGLSPDDDDSADADIEEGVDYDIYDDRFDDSKYKTYYTYTFNDDGSYTCMKADRSDSSSDSDEGDDNHSILESDDNREIFND